MTGVSCSTTLEQKSKNHLAQLITKHTKNLKAFLKTNVFWKLKNANDKETEILWKTSHFVNIAYGSVTKVGKQAQNDNIKFPLHLRERVRVWGKRVAFTLAEVLITLGIIGIVAAMTMPTLIQSHRKQEASARLKKFYSMMSQAIILSENDNGSAGDWNKVSKVTDESGNIVNNVNEYFDKYLKPYIKYTKIS